MEKYTKKQKSVCFLITDLDYGGAETLVVNLCKKLNSRHWQVKVISMIPPKAFVELLNSLDIEVESLGMRRGMPDPRAIFKLARLLRKWRPLVLHSHMVHANLLARIVRLTVSIPVVITTAHNIDEGGRLREYLYRLTDFLTDITTNVSQAAVERYIKIKAVPRHRIRFIPNGLNTNVYRPSRKFRHKLRNELCINQTFVWLAVGRFEAAKDYANMFAAFAQVVCTLEAKLLIAGQGTELEKCKKLVKKLGIEKQVQFLGIRNDVQELMNVADAYVMSSSWEGMPMVLLEAAATALPIVTTDVGGNREVVIDGSSGLLVPRKNHGVLADAMLNIMRKPEKERISMGNTGRLHVVKTYDLEHVISMWEDLYKEYLKNKHITL